MALQVHLNILPEAGVLREGRVGMEGGREGGESWMMEKREGRRRRVGDGGGGGGERGG